MMAWRLGRAIMQCVLLGLQRERPEQMGGGEQGVESIG